LERTGLGKSLFTVTAKTLTRQRGKGDLSPHGRKECQVSDPSCRPGRQAQCRRTAPLKAHQRRRTGIFSPSLDDPALGRPFTVALIAPINGQSAILIWSRPASAKRKCDIDRRPPRCRRHFDHERLFCQTLPSFRVAPTARAAAYLVAIMTCAPCSFTRHASSRPVRSRAACAVSLHRQSTFPLIGTGRPQPRNAAADFQPDPYLDYGRFSDRRRGIQITYKDHDVLCVTPFGACFAWTSQTGGEGWNLLYCSPVHALCSISAASRDWPSRTGYRPQTRGVYRDIGSGRRPMILEGTGRLLAAAYGKRLAGLSAGREGNLI